MVEAEGESVAPPGNVLRWLKVNFTVGMGVLTIVSGVAGALIEGTIRVNNYDHTLADLVKQTDAQHQINVDIDKRLNQAAQKTDDMRRERDEQVEALAVRITVLETQLRFFSERTPIPTFSFGGRRK